jgi:hypothetical protein
MHCQIFGLSEFYLGTARTREVLPLHMLAVSLPTARGKASKGYFSCCLPCGLPTSLSL